MGIQAGCGAGLEQTTEGGCRDVGLLRRVLHLRTTRNAQAQATAHRDCIPVASWKTQREAGSVSGHGTDRESGALSGAFREEAALELDGVGKRDKN